MRAGCVRGVGRGSGRREVAEVVGGADVGRCHSGVPASVDWLYGIGVV